MMWRGTTDVKTPLRRVVGGRTTHYPLTSRGLGWLRIVGRRDPEVRILDQTRRNAVLDSGARCLGSRWKLCGHPGKQDQQPGERERPDKREKAHDAYRFAILRRTGIGSERGTANPGRRAPSPVQRVSSVLGPGTIAMHRRCSSFPRHFGILLSAHLVPGRTSKVKLRG